MPSNFYNPIMSTDNKTGYLLVQEGNIIKSDRKYIYKNTLDYSNCSTLSNVVNISIYNLTSNSEHLLFPEDILITDIFESKERLYNDPRYITIIGIDEDTDVNGQIDSFKDKRSLYFLLPDKGELKKIDLNGLTIENYFLYDNNVHIYHKSKSTVAYSPLIVLDDSIIFPVIDKETGSTIMKKYSLVTNIFEELTTYDYFILNLKKGTDS